METNFLTWLSQSTQTMWWNDSANEQERQKAFSLGAVGMTTNPFLVNQTLQSDPGFWKQRLADIPAGLTGDEKVLALTKAVTGYYAQEFMPLFDKGETGAGYVCAQTNPAMTGDYAYMVEQAKQYAAWSPNIAVKLPATHAGIRAYEECVALGFNVVGTVSFTVPQVLALAAARERGKKRAEANGIKPGLAIAVLMVGRLDDYLRDVVKDQEADISESDIIQAGTASIKRAYEIFKERGYDTFLMPAGCRGAYHITELAGAKMIMSISPGIQKELLKLDGPFEERIAIPVDPDVIERLMKLKEFRRAYEPDGMEETEFITFGSTNRTTDQFINNGWKPLASFELQQK